VRGPALRIELVGRRSAADRLLEPPKAPGQFVGRREAVLGEADGGFEDLAERPAAEPVGQGRPPVHAPRDRDRGRQAQRHATVPGGPKCGGVEAAAAPPGGVEHRRGVVSGSVDDGEQVAADPARRGENRAQHRVGGDRSVGGVPAAGDDVEGGPGGEVMRCGGCGAAAGGDGGPDHRRDPSRAG